MAHVHYKFSSKLKYDTMVFDGLNITLKDLKKQIMDREKLRAADCDLQITNAQTKEEYKDDEDLIAKNSSIIVRRIPMVGVKSSGSKTTSKTMSKTTDRSDNQFHHHAFGSSKAMDNQSFSRSLTLLSQTCNLANANASEEDKIQAMMSQSNHEYDPINYVKKHGPPPPNYTCFRCGMNGHHIRNCPTNGDKTFESLPKIKKSTGIPRSFMVEVDDPNIKGAMLTHCGRYAIPTIDAEAYAKGKKERPPFAPPLQPATGSGEEEEEKKKKEEEEATVPTELLCLICREMLHDAVLIPCCGNSYCDDCIRSALLESDEHVCPTCDKVDVSPDTLVANKFLRQAVNSFNNEVGNQNSLATMGPSAPLAQTSSPSPIPNPPPPVSSTQIRPKTPYQQTRHQQDPLMSRPPPAHTPSLVQPNTTSPVATGPSSACSTPVNSPPRPQNQPDMPGSKEAEVSIDAAEPSIPSGSSSPVEGPAAPPPLVPQGYHVPVAEDLKSTSPKNTQMSPTYPTVRPSEQPPVKESSSTPSGPASGGVWTYPREGPGPSLPPPHPPSGPPPALHPPAVPHLPPHPQHFHPPPSPFPSMPFPPYPGFPPGYPFTAPPWAPPSLPSVCPTVPPPTLPPPTLPSTSSTSTSIPPLIPKEEMYRHQRRMKERSLSGRGSNRDRQSQQRPKPTVNEMGGDFAKELLEYRRMQRQRRRSYSRSPQRSSSVSQMSSDSYSRSRSYSRSPSRSPGRLRSRGRSRSKSRSRSRPRHRRNSARRHADRSHYHGYKCSRSPTPPSSSPSRRRRISRSRSRSRSRSWGSRQKKSGGRHHHRAGSHHDHHGNPGRWSTPSCDHYQHHAGCDAERFRLWEKEYMEWYEKYFGNYTGKPHHLQPPPLLPTPRSACGRLAPTSDQRPYSSASCSSKYPEPHPSRVSAKRSHSPPRQSPSYSPSPASDEDSGSLTYQQRCSEMFGHQASYREEPETKDRHRPALEHTDPPPTTYRPSSTDLDDQNHKKKKRRRNERDRAGMGEAEEAVALVTSCLSSSRGRGEGRSKCDSPGTSVHTVAVCSRAEPGDEAWASPYVGTLRGDSGREGQRHPGDEGSSAEPSRAREAGRSKAGEPRPDHSRSERKKRREDERNSDTLRKELLLGDRHLDSSFRSENAMSGRDGEESRHETKRQVNTAEKELGTRGSPTESPLWEGVMKMKKPQRKTISININLGGQTDEALKVGESDPIAGSLVKGDKMEAGDENEDPPIVEEDVEGNGGVKKQTAIPRAMEVPVGAGEVMKTVDKKRIRRADGGEVMEEEEELRAGARKRRGEEQRSERAKAPGRRSQSTTAAGETTVHTRRDRSEGRQERKRKTLEIHSSKDGFLHPEDKMVHMKVRSRWEPLEAEDEESTGKEELTSAEPQRDTPAALRPVSVSVPTKRAAARDGDTLEDGARAPQWEAEGEKEKAQGRSRETARRRSREVEGGFAPADAELGYNPGSAGRGSQRAGGGEGSRDQRGQQGRRATESERVSGGMEKRGPHSSRSTSSSRTTGEKRGREAEDSRTRNPERGTGAGGMSQSSSRSSSSSSSSFSQPDGVPQQAAAASVSSCGRRGGGRYREPDATPFRHERKAYATESPVATPSNRRDDDAEAGKHHHRHHQPQHHRNQDNHHENHPVREQRDHRNLTERPSGGPQPSSRPPGSSEMRDPRPLSSQRPAQQGTGADPHGAGAARGPPDKPRQDVFSRGRDALLRPRKPIDIKIISGASLFQHASLEEKNRV